jgi:hypothetical protein
LGYGVFAPWLGREFEVCFALLEEWWGAVDAAAQRLNQSWARRI